MMNVFWISEVTVGRIGIMSRPRGGDWLEDEIRSLRDSQVNVVVCLLMNDEIVELDVTCEPQICTDNQIDFISFPIFDRDVPNSTAKTAELVKNLADKLSQGKSIAIHCRMGIGRSSLIAACVLTQTGISADKAFQLIESARGCHVPDTIEQREWVSGFANRFSG